MRMNPFAKPYLVKLKAPSHVHVHLMLNTIPLSVTLSHKYLFVLQQCLKDSTTLISYSSSVQKMIIDISKHWVMCFHIIII